MDRKTMKKIFFSNKMAVICMVILLLIIVMSLLAPLSPYDPDASNVVDRLQGISTAHILGTDDIGRDTFTRTLYGGRISLLIGCAAMCVSTIFGTFIGTFSGYFGGIADVICMRIVDVFMSIPSLLFIIVVYASEKPCNFSGNACLFFVVKGSQSSSCTDINLKRKRFCTCGEGTGSQPGKNHMETYYTESYAADYRISKFEYR